MTASPSSGWQCVKLSDGSRVAWPTGIRFALLETYQPGSTACDWRTFGELSDDHKTELRAVGWPGKVKR